MTSERSISDSNESGLRSGSAPRGGPSLRFLSDGESLSLDQLALWLQEASTALDVAPRAKLRSVLYQDHHGVWWPFGQVLTLSPESDHLGREDERDLIQGALRLRETPVDVAAVSSGGAIGAVFLAAIGRDLDSAPWGTREPQDTAYVYRHPSDSLWGRHPVWSFSLHLHRVGPEVHPPQTPRGTFELPSGRFVDSVGAAAAEWLGVPGVDQDSHSRDQLDIRVVDSRGYFEEIRRRGEELIIRVGGRYRDVLSCVLIERHDRQPGGSRQVTLADGVGHTIPTAGATSADLYLRDLEGRRYDWRSEWAGLRSADGRVMLSTAGASYALVELSPSAQAELGRQRSASVLTDSALAARLRRPPKAWWQQVCQAARAADVTAQRAELAAKLHPFAGRLVGPQTPLLWDVEPSLPALSDEEALTALDRFLVEEERVLQPGGQMQAVHWDALTAAYFPLRERYQALHRLVEQGVLQERLDALAHKPSGLRFPLTVTQTGTKRMRSLRHRLRHPLAWRLEQWTTSLGDTFPGLVRALAWMGGGAALGELIRRVIQGLVP